MRPNVKIVSAYGGLAARSAKQPNVLFVAYDRASGLMARGGCVVKTTPYVKMLVLALAARPKHAVSRAELVDLLYGERPDGGPETAANAVSIHFNTAKPAFAALGYHVESVGHLGYRAWPALFMEEVA